MKNPATASLKRCPDTNRPLPCPDAVQICRVTACL